MLFRIFLCVLSAALLTGCQQYASSFTTANYMRPPELFRYDFNAQALINAERILQGEDLQIPPDYRNTQYNWSSLTKVPVITEVEMYAVYKSGSNGPHYRDFLQDVLIKRSDTLCETFIDDMFIRVAARQLAFDDIIAVANAVGTFAGGAAQEMNLVAAIAGGLNGAYDKRILQERMISLIITEIETTRAAQKKVIYKKRVKNGTRQELAEYSLAEALLDVSAYHDQCAFLRSISALETRLPRAAAAASEDGQ